VISIFVCFSHGQCLAEGLLTKADMNDLYKQGNKRCVRTELQVKVSSFLPACFASTCFLCYASLFAVGDISCDVNGSIEFLQHTTTIDKPFFGWNPITNKESEITEDTVAVMGVDILPTELSVESSKHFGDSLMPLLKQLIIGGYSNEAQNIDRLPTELANACIARDGALTPNFQYIDALMKRPAVVHQDTTLPHILLRIKVSYPEDSPLLYSD